jgi:hypothetical protein
MYKIYKLQTAVNEQKVNVVSDSGVIMSLIPGHTFAYYQGSSVTFVVDNEGILSNFNIPYNQVLDKGSNPVGSTQSIIAAYLNSLFIFPANDLTVNITGGSTQVVEVFSGDSRLSYNAASGELTLTFDQALKSAIATIYPEVRFYQNISANQKRLRSDVYALINDDGNGNITSIDLEGVTNDLYSGGFSIAITY